MGNNVAFGIVPEAWDIIKQIDVLWIQGKAIIAAFRSPYIIVIAAPTATL
jgi:hypothetical protein